MRNDLQHGFSRNLLTSKQKSYYENCFPEGLNKSADFIFHKSPLILELKSMTYKIITRRHLISQ